MKRYFYITSVKLQGYYRKLLELKKERMGRGSVPAKELELLGEDCEEGEVRGFKLEEDAPLTIEKNEKSYGSL